MQWSAVVLLLINGRPTAYEISPFDTQRKCEAYLLSVDFDVDLAYLKQLLAAQNPKCQRAHCTQERAM